MYFEHKGKNLTGQARIGRVTFSKTYKTLYYNDIEFRSLKGYGYKANYYDVETQEFYWISGCKKQGDDSLYPATVTIDNNAREEYWNEIRKLPQNANQTSFRSEGKYSNRKPN